MSEFHDIACQKLHRGGDDYDSDKYKDRGDQYLPEINAFLL